MTDPSASQMLPILLLALAGAIVTGMLLVKLQVRSQTSLLAFGCSLTYHCHRTGESSSASRSSSSSCPSFSTSRAI